MPPTHRDEREPSLDPTLPAESSGGAGTASRHGGGLLAPVEPRRYEVGAELARGGLGRILRARDCRLDRPVAIKELLRAESYDQARFAREALVTARLMHPAIVPVYEAGTWPDGSAFYAMKLVEGRSLERVITDAIEPAERLALLPRVIDVANALAYAHERRIIHRDLKPANILVGAHGETVVIDWGLAKDLGAPESAPARAAGAGAADSDAVTGRAATPASDSDLGATVEGTVMGTPAYMPPEQARGEAVDERADVYAIGAVLYHVLAGEPPYRGRTTAEVLRQVLSGPPDPLERTAPGLPPDLLAIVRRAMAYERKDRYPSARELAEDLTRFQSGQLVVAHQYSAWTLAARFLRRHRGAVAVALVALALAAVFGALGVRRLVEAKRRAELARQDAEAERRRADERADQLALMQARLALDTRPVDALTWLARLSPQFDGWSAVRAIAADALARGVPSARLPAGPGASGVAIADDGAFVAVTAAEGGAGGEARVLLVDAASGQRVTLGAAARGVPARFVPGSRTLVRVAATGAVEVWDPRVGQLRALGVPGRDRHAGEVRALVVGRELAVTGGADGRVRVWPLAGGAVVTLDAGAPVARVALAPDGAQVAAASDDGVVRVWVLPVGAQRLTHRHKGPVGALAFAPDGAHLASASGDTIALWDLADGLAPDAAVEEHDAGQGEVTAVAFTPDGRLLLSGGRDRRVLAWTVAPGACPLRGAPPPAAVALSPAMRELAARTARDVGGHGEAIVALAVAPDGHSVAVAGGPSLTLLPVCPPARGAARPAGPGARDDARARRLAAHDAPVVALAWAGGGRLATLDDGELLVWDPDRIAGARIELGAPVSALALGGGRAVAGLEDGRVLAWDGRTLAPLHAHEGRVTAVDVGGGGAVVASGGWDDRVRLWRAGAGPGASSELARQKRDVTAVAVVDLGGERVVAASGDGTVTVHDPAGDRRQVLGEPGAGITALAITPDGRTLAAASDDGAVRVWTLPDGKLVARQDPGRLAALAVSADGAVVAWALAGEGRVALWRVREGRVAVLPPLHDGPVAALAFVGAGWLVSAGEGGVVRWDVETERGTRFGPRDAATALPRSGARALPVGYADGAVRVLDVEGGELRAAGRLDGAVTAIAVAPDGTTMVAGGASGELRWFVDDLPWDPAALRSWLATLLDKSAANH